MLSLNAKLGDVIIIEKDIICTVIQKKCGSLVLGFDFPEHKTVFRQGLIDKAYETGTLQELYAKSEQAKLDLAG